MKVLALSTPGAGHVRPLLPLIEALLAQGDEVTVAAGEDPGGVLSRTGARFAVAGRGEMDWFADLQARVLRGQPGDGLAPERINHYFFPRLFAEVAAPDMIDDVVALGRELRPDLVVFETYALAGPLAAEVLGVPAVHHLISPILPHEVSALGDDAVSPMWRSFGCDTLGHGGLYRGVTVEVSPPTLEGQRVPAGEALAMRPAPLPGREPERVDPPCVYVTLGTFFGMNTDVFRTALAGLAGEDLEVVVTVGADNDPAALGPVPANTRVERFVPQADLLPRCSAVVHHGGAGTMFGALAHGVPQVVLPQGADNFVNGGLLDRCGAGVVIGPDARTPDAVRRAVRGVLGESSYLHAARRLADEVAALPAPADVAGALRDRFGA
ncbi:MAG TPA: glycosyltransferase [Acidimicrobiales bacterium]|nr:glycosyltransferase [Acidimicrobiales bacterium]